MTKKYDKMVVKKSDKSGKKYMAVFTESSSGRTKTTHFGDSSATDYLLSRRKTDEQDTGHDIKKI